MEPGVSGESFNDGLIPHGVVPGAAGQNLSGVFQVNRNGAAVGFFKFESIDAQRPTKSTDVTNPDGSPLGGFDVVGFDTATAEVQIPTATGPFLKRGDYISENFYPGSGATEMYRITEVGQAYQMDGYWKHRITLKKVYNPANYISSSQ